jgi:hypothetical protein
MSAIEAPATLDEITRTIVELLKPWRPWEPQWRKFGWPINDDGPPGSWVNAMIIEDRLLATPADRQAKAWVAKQEAGQPSQEDGIAAAVREAIDLLRDVIPDFFSRTAIRKTRAAARAVVKTIDKLETLVEASPELRLRIPIKVKDLHPDSHPARLIAELKWLGETCKDADNATLTTGRKDQVKEWCLRVAWSLIQRFSAQKPSYGPGTAFPRITALIHEAVTHEREESDFRVLCQNWLTKVGAAEWAAKVAAD